MNTVQTNIMTAEDPVEFNLMGINQVQMKEQIGLNFAAALRAFLRQDPNIVLVGEIRDFETAEIAIVRTSGKCRWSLSCCLEATANMLPEIKAEANQWLQL